MAGVTGEGDSDWRRHGRWGPYRPTRAFDSPEERHSLIGQMQRGRGLSPSRSGAIEPRWFLIPILTTRIGCTACERQTDDGSSTSRETARPSAGTTPSRCSGLAEGIPKVP